MSGSQDALPASRRTNRVRRVLCEIARSAVRIELRSGQGFQEPGRLYVRCEERDCQYADRNEPPCPLHVDMFRDRADDILLQFLVREAGAAVCYDCLGTSLHLAREQVRDAAWRLTADAGCRLGVRTMRCVRCGERRLTIRATGLAATPSRGRSPAADNGGTRARVQACDDASGVTARSRAGP
jgi:hypothetical protein